MGSISSNRGHSLQIGVQEARYNENFDIKTILIGSGVVAGQRSKGRGCFSLYFFGTLLGLDRLVDFN